MTDISVVQVGDPVLRRRASEVAASEAASETVAQLEDAMWNTLDVIPGVGLAAPQIGESIRVIVAHDPSKLHETIPPALLVERERSPIEPYVLINPVLTPVGQETRTFFEGCLSVEGYVAAVERHLEVEVEFIDSTGTNRHHRVRGWHARILQHEIDHLDGTLYVDRMNPRTLCNAEQFSAFRAMPAVDVIRALTASEA